MEVFRFLKLKLKLAVLCDWLKVMVVLLEEDQAEKKSLRKLGSQTDTLSFSDGGLQLNTKLPFLYGKHSCVDLQKVAHACDYTTEAALLMDLLVNHRPQHQPGAILSGPEAPHDVSPQPYNESQRRAS